MSTQILMSLVEAKPVMAGVMGGIGSSFVLQLPVSESIVFAGTCALGVSLGDALLTGAGYETKIESYLDGGFSTYFDPMDFVGAGLGVMLINLALGVRGRPLVVTSAIAAVAGGIAPKLSAKILSDLSSSHKAKTGSKGPGGETVKA